MKKSFLKVAMMVAVIDESLQKGGLFTEQNIGDPIVQAKIESWSWENPKYKSKSEQPKSKFIPNKKRK